MGTLLLFGIGGATAQSLGDYARQARKNKPEPTTASRHFDNDNLPTDQPLSVVGPTPSATTNDAGSDAAKTAAAGPAPSDAEKQKKSGRVEEKAR
jgi:hypothetical protein